MFKIAEINLPSKESGKCTKKIMFFARRYTGSYIKIDKETCLLYATSEYIAIMGVLAQLNIEQ